MSPGIYALVSLSGAPLQISGLEALQLNGHVLAEGLAARGVDPQPGAIDLAVTPRAVTILAGFLDEREELAAALGLDSATAPALLAAAALLRFGKDAPAHMLGEWSLLQWQPQSRQLTLVASEGIRDPMFFAIGEGLVAVAPSAMLIGRLGWVGLALDPAGFALGVSRGGLRHILRSETIWKGIRSLAPGTTEVFSPTRRTTTETTGESSFERWNGTFDEGADALDAMGRRIIRQLMDRHPSSAFLLSGGLDSTLLNCWAADARGPGRDFFALSSVAPPGSGISDELRYIEAVTHALNIPLRTVWPEREENLFQPPAELFQQSESMVGGPYLVHQAFDAVALAAGASAIVDGNAGEMHISRGFDIPETRSWLRLQLASVRDKFAHRQRYSGWPQAAFHVRLHPDLMHALPADWPSVWRKGPPQQDIRLKGDPPMGIDAMAHKQSGNGTAGLNGLRNLHPYRDKRLMRLAARMPVSFLSHEGMTRPLARKILRSRVPKLVWARENTSPFSPDYVPRLKRQAARAQTRIPLYEQAGVGRWLDLQWLREALIRLAVADNERDYKLYFEVQGTATAAEFLLWAQGSGITF